MFDEENIDAADALSFLQAVYKNKLVPVSTRIRCAVAALPFEKPRLAVTAVIEASSLAAKLEERRLRRIQQMKLIEVKPVEEGTKPKTDLTLPPPTIDRRFRRRV
jgi:hypothetical protein